MMAPTTPPSALGSDLRQYQLSRAQQQPQQFHSKTSEPSPAQSHVHYSKRHQSEAQIQRRADAHPYPYQYTQKSNQLKQQQQQQQRMHPSQPQYHASYSSMGHYYSSHDASRTRPTTPTSKTFVTSPTLQHPDVYSSGPIPYHASAVSLSYPPLPSPKLRPFAHTHERNMTLPPIRSFSASGIRGGDAENSRKRNQMSDGPLDHDILFFGSRTHPRPMDPPPSPTPSLGHDDEMSDDLGPQENERETADNPKTSEAEPEVFRCTIPNCGLVVENDDLLSAHVQQCEKRLAAQQYPCPEPGCDESFSTAHKLLRHRSVHKVDVDGNSPPTDFLCRWKGCGKVLATRKSLKDHEQIHREKTDGTKFNCTVPGCGKSFETTRCRRAHELRCKQVKSGSRIPCPVVGCKQTFGSSDYVRRHVLDHEKGLVGVKFRCEHPGCDAVLANPLTLQRHQQLHEEQLMGFLWVCLVDGCGKPYSGSKQLTDHQGRIHKDLEANHMFPCPHKLCEGKFSCQREAYKHEGCLEKVLDLKALAASNSETEPKVVIILDDAESSDVAVTPKEETTDEATNHSKIVCREDECACVLPSQAALDDHIWMHKNLTARPPYPCFADGCDHSFMTRKEILNHSISHYTK
ncbi:MAG: hypothetical protein J3Q66DRAFT_387424 [Benniella sp.]|nr:MAG: hypothetical protein J3Q66DRAFT_387424 [Benniella sp.]